MERRTLVHYIPLLLPLFFGIHHKPRMPRLRLLMFVRPLFRRESPLVLAGPRQQLNVCVGLDPSIFRIFIHLTKCLTFTPFLKMSIIVLQQTQNSQRNWLGKHSGSVPNKKGKMSTQQHCDIATGNSY